MDIFAYLALCFTSLFTLMDPLGVMPVFLQMADGMDTKERRMKIVVFLVTRLKRTEKGYARTTYRRAKSKNR